LGAAIVLVVFLSLWWQPGLSASSSMAAPPKHKYLILLTVSKDSTLEKTMGQQFLAEIKKDNKTTALNVTVVPKSWTDAGPCKGDLACDRIAINTEKRTLLFTCNGTNYYEQPGPPCQAATDALFREKCIDTLPQDLPKQLWNHSKAFHKGEDQ
jgi:hypothetical protein